MKTNRILTLVGVASVFALLAGCAPKDDTATHTGPKGSQTFKTEIDPNSLSVEGPDGSKASIGNGTSVTEAEVGLPFYPGSTELPGETMRVETPTEKSYLSVRTTSDDPKTVQQFYESKAADLKFNFFETGEMAMAAASVTRKDGSKAAVSAIRKKGETLTKVTIGWGLEAKNKTP